MRVIMFEAHEEATEFFKWLDTQLVGLNLRKLISELEVIRGESEELTGSLDELLGDQLSDALEYGTAKLSSQQLTRLLNRPRLLLELQERILDHWGAYWESIERSPEDKAELAGMVERIKQKLISATAAESSAGTSPTVTPATLTTTSATESSGTWNKFLALALAAALLLALGNWLWTPAPGNGWGFNRNGLLTANVSGKVYLSSLADAAGEWSNKRPANAKELENRLTQFRTGCKVLIEAPHRQLSDEDRDWLVSSCQRWSGRIDEFLSRLQSNSGSQTEVQREADEMIFQMQQKLRERALQTG